MKKIQVLAFYIHPEKEEKGINEMHQMDWIDKEILHVRYNEINKCYIILYFQL